MSIHREPILPAPRIEIWLTPRRPWLWLLFFGVVAIIIFCIIPILIISNFVAFATSNENPTSAFDANASFTKAVTATFTKRPPTKLLPTRTQLPTATTRPSQTSTQDFWADCNASYESRLKVGDQAYVSNNPPLRNRIRSGPYVNNDIIGFIDPGEKVEILDGPSCSNHWVWWKVKSIKNGEVGWTSEGDETNYWLVPIR